MVRKKTAHGLGGENQSEDRTDDKKDEDEDSGDDEFGVSGMVEDAEASFCGSESVQYRKIHSDDHERHTSRDSGNDTGEGSDDSGKQRKKINPPDSI